MNSHSGTMCRVTLWHWAQGGFDILAGKEEMHSQFNGRKCCFTTELFNRHVIHLCFAIRAETLVLEEYEDVGAIGTDDRITVTTTSIDGVDLARH